MNSTRSVLPRILGFGILAVAAVVAVIVIAGGSDKGHNIYVTVPKATGVLRGQQIRAGGSVVGSIKEIKPVNKGRAARMKLNLDDTVWPLPQGSTFELRWSGTIDEYNRYIALNMGKQGAQQLVSDGGTIPAKDFKVPVEYGELLSIFNKQTRGDLKGMIDAGGPALDKAGKPLHDALVPAPAAVNTADKVVRDLDASEENLSTLIRSTGDVVDAVDRANPTLGDLISGAAGTLNATAIKAKQLEQTLDEAPATFTNVRDTAKRADSTLLAAQTLTTKLSPGVDQLQALLHPLNGLLDSLVKVGPDARATLGTLQTNAPTLTSFVGKVNDVMPQVKSISDQAYPELDCIRPYTPELAAFGSDWGSALSGSDGKDKFIRANAEALVPALSNVRSDNSASAVKTAGGGLYYAFPRPPGYMAGDPWYQPQCGITSDSLDPNKDPEARNTGTAPPPITPSIRKHGAKIK